MAETMLTRSEFEGLDMKSWQLDMEVWSSMEKSRLKTQFCTLPACRLYS